MQQRIKTLEDSVEAERKARENADAQRVQSEISAAVVDSLTKRNAMDPKEFSKLIVGNIKVNEDGTYGYIKPDGTSGTVDDCVDEWLKVKIMQLKMYKNAEVVQAQAVQEATILAVISQ